MVTYARTRTNSDALEFRDVNQQTYRGLDGVVKGDNSAHGTRHTDGNDDIQDATAAQKGLATAAQITKLDGIAAFANGWVSTGTFTYASADAPTYTVTVASGAASIYSAGMKVKFTHAAAVKYFIITKVADTVLTLYGGTDYTLADTAITLPYYSMVKAPLGFPIQPTKWSATLSSSTDRTTNTPTQNTWYNAESLAIPIGIWMVKIQCLLSGYDTSATAVESEVTLSTANNSESDANWTMQRKMEAVSGTLQFNVGCYRELELALATKDTYYLNYRSTLAAMAQIQVLASISYTKIIAESVYL